MDASHGGPTWIESELRARLDDHAARWSVTIEELTATPSSLLAFGTREDRSVVLKIARAGSDEQQCGAMMRAIGDAVCATVIAHDEGATLMERLVPGTPLTGLVTAGRDDEATAILARLIATTKPSAAPEAAISALRWGDAFDRYLDSRDVRIPRALVENARGTWRELCATERAPRLLHGDVHHDNILFDTRRGWTLVDPKGIIGEVELELATLMHNPASHPEHWLSRQVIDRRLAIIARHIDISIERALRWAYAHAVLSATWSAEDGEAVDEEMGVLRLAGVLGGGAAGSARPPGGFTPPPPPSPWPR